MNTTAASLSSKSIDWLSTYVFPLWSHHGIDHVHGGFIESLMMDGSPSSHPKRALVQARQVYSFVTGAKLQVFNTHESKKIVTSAMEFFTKNYITSSGACVHSIVENGSVHNQDLDLYTQAFAMFAYANAYELVGDKKYIEQALKILSYLKNERTALGGGYTEIKGGKVFYQSNPHMHLFESALLWASIDTRDEWKNLCHELYQLCLDKFIDKKTMTLCEHFDEGWTPQLENGSFIFEPGHHFEWSWLLALYQELFNIDCKSWRHSIYQTGTKYGVNDKNFVVDEVWSNGRVKKSSSRFWPQCERIKAAVKLGHEVSVSEQRAFAKQADEALRVLLEYFQTPVQGLWQDQLLENGEFTKQDPKGSSLYHIINAIYEYERFRPKLADD